MSSRPWFLPVAVVVTCLPCLLIPVTAALIAAGAFGGVLGLLGVPWVLALVAAAPIVLAIVVLRVLRLRRGSASCEVATGPVETPARVASTDAWRRGQ